MKISLIKGAFEAEDMLNIITQMVHVKIKYHEDQIKFDDSEEQIKMREKRIVELQRDLFDLRKKLIYHNKQVHVDAEIKVEFVNHKAIA